MFPVTVETSGNDHLAWLSRLVTLKCFQLTWTALAWTKTFRGTCVDCIKMNSTSFQVNGVTYSDKEEKRSGAVWSLWATQWTKRMWLVSVNYFPWIFWCWRDLSVAAWDPFSPHLNQSRLDMVKDLYAAGARLRENSTEGRQPWNRMRSDLHCCLRSDDLFNFFMETDPNSFEGFELLYDAIDVIEYNCSTNCIFNGVENKLKRAGADFSPRGAGLYFWIPWPCSEDLINF